MAQGRKRSREISNLDNQLGGEEEVAVFSSSAKRPRQNRIRVPFTCATRLFEFTKNLGFKRDGETVEWLIQQLESDQDPHKFSSPDELLIVDPPLPHTMMVTPPPQQQEGRPRVTKDRHRLTEDGRDRRVRVPTNCVPQIVDLTEKLRLKSDGETIEWLFTKYGLSTQQTIQSTTTSISTPTITDNGSFSGAYVSPDNDSSIPCHDHQQNLEGHYEQGNLMRPAFTANPNSLQYRFQLPSLPYYPTLPPSAAGGTANQLQFTSYPQQQSMTHPNTMNFQSLLPNARGRLTVNDGLIREGSRSTFEPSRQMGSLQYNPCLYPQGLAHNLSYSEQIWQPYSTKSLSNPQSYFSPNPYWLPSAGINSGNNAISMNLTYPQKPHQYDNQYSNDQWLIPYEFDGGKFPNTFPLPQIHCCIR